MVNVYDLSAANDYTWSFGLGVFHSGVEVCGQEWTFSASGVFHMEPRFAPGAVFRESICVGEVVMGSREVEDVVNGLRELFPGNEYHVVTRNCNSFSSALCKALLKKDVYPAYVNRLANLGSCCSCLWPREGARASQIPPPGQSSAYHAFSGSWLDPSETEPTFCTAVYSLN